MNQNEQLKNILYKNPFILIELLLEKNAIFELSAESIVLLQYIWLNKTKNNVNLSHQELADLAHIEVKDVRKILTELIKDDFIHLISTKQDGKINEEYDLSPLINKCLEAKLIDAKPTNAVFSFVEQVELEFSRKLSPIEIQYIQGWIFDDHVSLEILEEALKESVLSGVRNFKYMSAIIHNWQNNNAQVDMTKKSRNNTTVLKDFSQEDKAIAKFDWERALNEDEG